MSGEPWVMAAPEFGDADERLAQFDRGRVIAVVPYDEEAGEAEVMLHPEFAAAPDDDVCALDMLSDAIGLLEREHERRAAAMRKRSGGVVMEALGYEA
jgi:hypothetical protein